MEKITTHQMIIVIGLPGSGKTRFCNEILSFTHIIFDDFIKNFFNGELLKAISSGKKICINDPRMCLFPIFEKYMRIFEKYIAKNDIFICLFTNDPQKCLINIEKNKNSSKKNIAKTVMNYSQHYIHENYVNWNYCILEIKT